MSEYINKVHMGKKYFSMFSGIGGFELAIKQVHTEWECVGYSEIDKYACQIYNQHFNHHNYGDATQINARELPDFDLLVGGFPCQSFSVAGKRRGFEDTRGTLFFDIARILEEKKPQYVLLENVKGLLSHEFGRTFQTIIGVLTDLGYRVQWQVLNSKDFRVPQNRERVFIVGDLGGRSGRKIFPITSTAGAALNFVGGVGDKKWLDDGKNKSRNYPQGSRVYNTNGIAPALSSQNGGFGGKTGLYVARVNRSANIYKTKGLDASGRTGVISKKNIYPVLTPNRVNKRQNGRRFKQSGEPAFTLTGLDIHGIYDGYRVRKLTPVECERLQGFPDNWTVGVSDTQRYKCLGNAVTVNVVASIMEHFDN